MLIGNFETMKHKIILGAITGAIAEAYYKEIPEHIVTGVLKRLPDEFKEVMERFYENFVGA